MPSSPDTTIGFEMLEVFRPEQAAAVRAALAARDTVTVLLIAGPNGLCATSHDAHEIGRIATSAIRRGYTVQDAFSFSALGMPRSGTEWN